jgi:hypothetical protein
MFIRTDLQNKLIPIWKSTRYINMSNVLRLEVEKNTVTFYTVFRPLKPATSISFESNLEAIKWADQFVTKQTSVATSLVRTDQAAVDPLAIQAMADWDKEREEQKLK